MWQGRAGQISFPPVNRRTLVAMKRGTECDNMAHEQRVSSYRGLCDSARRTPPRDLTGTSVGRNQQLQEDRRLIETLGGDVHAVANAGWTGETHGARLPCHGTMRASIFAFYSPLLFPCITLFMSDYLPGRSRRPTRPPAAEKPTWGSGRSLHQPSGAGWRKKAADRD